MLSWHSTKIYLAHLWVKEGKRGTNYLSFSISLHYGWLLQ